KNDKDQPEADADDEVVRRRQGAMGADRHRVERVNAVHDEENGAAEQHKGSGDDRSAHDHVERDEPNGELNHVAPAWAPGASSGSVSETIPLGGSGRPAHMLATRAIPLRRGPSSGTVSSAHASRAPATGRPGYRTRHGHDGQKSRACSGK